MSPSPMRWEELLNGIEDGYCTPFLGAAINLGILPTGSQVARPWAEKYEYPLKDDWDLIRVSQYVAVHRRNMMLPKDLIVRELRAKREEWLSDNDFPAFVAAAEHPLAVVANLPFPVYITTNYDDLIVRAIELCSWQERPKRPHREVCPWNRHVREHPDVTSVFDQPDGFTPTAEEPVVFHLHGSDDIRQSLVLTESDYLDFLVNVNRDQSVVLPARIQQALGDSTLLFMGYSLADWSFRVLLRGVIQSLDPGQRRPSVAVQLPPDDVKPGAHEAAAEYLEEYLGSIGNIDVQVYWGDVRDFAAELRSAWEAR